MELSKIVKYIESQSRRAYSATLINKKREEIQVIVIEGESNEELNGISFIYLHSPEENIIKLYEAQSEDKLTDHKLLKFNDESIYEYLTKHFKVVLNLLLSKEDYDYIVEDKLLFDALIIIFYKSFTNLKK